MNDPLVMKNEALLAPLQRAAFDYFLENTNPANGLIADNSRKGAPCSIAVTGFGLTSYVVGVERGWLSRADAINRTLKVLEFFWKSASGSEDNVTGYKGFFYHFLDMNTGLRAWDCELSMIDTALLIAGMLTAATYFSGSDPDECRIRYLADQVYRRVDWEWARNNGNTLSQGWKPGCGFLHYGWDGYNEAGILYILAVASPTYPLQPDGYKDWGLTYQWENIYGHDVLYAGPLFIHQFSHIWVDFRGIRDVFMREKGSDYFQNSRSATLIQREYGRRNPLRLAGYNENCWGLSACDGPAGKTVRIGERERYCFGYAARGAPFGPDDGTIAPAAMLASLPFAADVVIPALKHLMDNYPYVIQANRIPTSFNPSVKTADGKAWVADAYFGLDQGAIVLMLENARSDLIWNVMHQCTYIVAGLKRAGFRGGWLS
jgi:hypothetical protein